MRAADLVTAGALMLVAGVVIVDAARLGIGWGTDGPKSGFFPFRLGLLLRGGSAVVVLSVGIAVAAFLLFETWFLVPMPKGPLEEWLGY